ncbi:MAG TPA: biopolymer transporter ExbD [Bacteroidia bacterium]|jgi:biopolymer transport protein ExbD|nr:biopolymer transporter ExbD [Bacteroidia bacterium]
MADVNTGDDGGGKKGKKKRPKKGSTRIDMTPMVDLAFLLLTFFILATTLSKPKTMEIVYPKDVKDPKENMELNFRLANTLILGEKDDQIFYYPGKFKLDTTKLEKVNLSKDGLRKLFLDKNKNVVDVITKLEDQYKNHQIADSTFKRLRSKAKGDDLAPFFIVKTLDKTKYKTVIDVIDELNISNVGKYAVVDISPAEKIALKREIKE